MFCDLSPKGSTGESESAFRRVLMAIERQSQQNYLIPNLDCTNKMLFTKRKNTNTSDQGNGIVSPTVSRRRWLKPVAVLLTVVMAAGSLVAWRANASKKDDPKKTEDKVFEFSQGDLALLGSRELGNVIPVSGTLKPLTQAIVKSKVAADVARVHVQEGERVTAGQILVSLDTADLRARLDAQQAVVAEMKARLDA